MPDGTEHKNCVQGSIAMQLREKLVELRGLAGERRGLGRPMTQVEVTKALRAELGYPLSQAYLSQLERGKRVHLSNTSREALARFFQVHPGYLVSDLAETGTALPAAGSPSSVPGLGLAPDLSGPVHSASALPASSFPARSFPRRIAPRRWESTAAQAPNTRQLNADSRLQDLLYQLRDHPQAERVLVLVEHILRLPPRALAELEKVGCQLGGEDLHG